MGKKIIKEEERWGRKSKRKKRGGEENHKGRREVGKKIIKEEERWGRKSKRKKRGGEENQKGRREVGKKIKRNGTVIIQPCYLRSLENKMKCTIYILVYVIKRKLPISFEKQHFQI